MATLIIQHTSTGTGLAVSYAFAAAGGDVYPNQNQQTLIVQNLSSASVVVTITAQRACNQGTLHTLAFSVPAGAIREMGPFASQFYNDASGDVDISYSAVALPAPSAPGLSAAGSGGTWTAQTAWVKVTLVNAQGETVASAVSSQAVAASGTLTITSPAAAGSGAGAATGWYAYIGTGASEPADASKHRQQTLGSPTPIGTNLTLTANPTTGGAAPPASNTASALQVAVTAP